MLVTHLGNKGYWGGRGGGTGDGQHTTTKRGRRDKSCWLILFFLIYTPVEFAYQYLQWILAPSLFHELYKSRSKEFV